LSTIRILIADDYADWRSQVRSLLQAQPEWQVIAEALDGSEAIQKAEELKPDLVVLDIGLPKLNGIEAARRIRQLSPSSKIIFLSQNNDPDVVRAALSTGAQGYVCKTDARRELVLAVDVVLRGKQFVSSSLEGNEFTDSSGEKSPHRHEVLFYSDDTVLLDSVTRFIAAALKAGNAAIVVATESHRDSLLLRLRTHGLDIGAAIEQGRYIALDAADALPKFMLRDVLGPVRFLQALGNYISKAAKTFRGKQARVGIFGEMCHLLLAQGNAEAAIQVEKLGNQLSETYDVDILCGYSVRNLQGGMDSHIFQRICAEHSAVYSR
jgi:DNA-binding NarL/FixJ family response regulator